MNSEIFWRSDWYQMYSLHSDVYFSNLMDADRLYNNFVGQEMNVQPTSENSVVAADLCSGKIESSFCLVIGSVTASSLSATITAAFDYRNSGSRVFHPPSSPFYCFCRYWN